jgi:hypothetical protein
MAPATKHLLGLAPLPRSAQLKRGLVIPGLLLLAAVAGRAAGPESKPPKDSGSKLKQVKPSAVPALDKLKLPPNAIVVICNEDEAVRLVPRQIMLTPAEYQKLKDRITELEKKLKPARPLSPSTCRLKVLGPLENDSVRVDAEFKFKTKGKIGHIALGCQGGNPTRAELDGQETLLEEDEEGYAIHVEQGDQGKSEHVLTLELNPSVATRGKNGPGEGNDRGFEVSLPRAALTTLELERMPAGVGEVRCNDDVIRKAGEKVGLGPAKTLTVTWKKPAGPAGTTPLLTADGKVTVTVNEKTIVTVADLTLRDERGQTRDWILGAPAGATVEVIPPAERPPPLPRITFDPKKQEHVIHLKEATADPLRVVLRVEQPRTAGRLNVGPFDILNARRQPAGGGAVLRRHQGTITIKEPPPSVFLSYFPSTESRLRVKQKEELSDEERRAGTAAVFEYSHAIPVTQPGATGRPWLGLEVKMVRGVVETRVKHTLKLEPAEQGWQVDATMTIVVESGQTPVRSLTVQLPQAWPETLALLACWPRAGLPVNLALAVAVRTGNANSRAPWPPVTGRYQLLRQTSTSEVVESISPLDAAGRIQIKLAAQKERKQTIVLKGLYRVPPGVQRVRLELPRLVQTLQRDSEVEMSVPPEQELARAGPDAEILAPGSHTHSLRPAPGRLEFAWRPYRPELAVKVETDVTFTQQSARVRQRIQFPPRQELPGQVLLRLGGNSAKLRGTGPRVVAGGRLDPDPGGAGDNSWLVALQLKKERTLELEYAFAAPAVGRVAVPLLWPEQATRVETKVRLWSEAGAHPGLQVIQEGERWRQDHEVLPDSPSMPELVLHGQEKDVPLVLELRQGAWPTLASVLVERALIRAVALPGGSQTYRARFRLSRWNTRRLMLELPPAASRLSVHLGRTRLTPRKQDAGTPAGEGGAPAALYQLELPPKKGTDSVILDIVYQIDPADAAPEGAESGGWFGNWQTTLRPPVLRSAVFLGRVRWQVQMNSGQVIVHAGQNAVSEQEWGLRGWLLAPQAGLSSAELEEWLSGSAAPAGSEESSSALVCWQGSPQPLHLIYLPQKTWLLTCSLLFLVVGLGLSIVPLARGPLRVLGWSVAILGGLALAVTVFLWPDVLPAILYGCEPGVVILVLVLAVEWMLQRRYRRQLVFMPGFSRLKPGSSLVRAGNSNRPREPSTIDVPPVPDNSAAPRAT